MSPTLTASAGGGSLRSAARSIFRLLTYSPIALLRERRQLRNALRTWNGDHLFLFPYLNAGGAEQVHTDIISAVKDHDPLVIICGFSANRAFADRFANAGRLLELPRLLNHPYTRAAAHRALARKLDDGRPRVLFSSLTTTFFALLPLIGEHVKTHYLQHAFLFQSEGNQQQKSWLPVLGRVDHFLFVSQHAMAEFERFLVTNNIPQRDRTKLRFMPNAVHEFGEVREHNRTGVLFVGRNSPEKRLDLFLAIAAELERMRPGHFRFTIVGVEGKQTSAPVVFKGLVQDAAALNAIYADHDLLLLTSSREGFPMVIMEAMAHGLVVASTPVGDVPNRMDDDFSFVTSAVDEETVVREMTAFVRAIDNDRERMRTMKQGALEKARSEFALEAFNARYRSLLISPAVET